MRASWKHALAPLRPRSEIIPHLGGKATARPDQHVRQPAFDNALHLRRAGDAHAVDALGDPGLDDRLAVDANALGLAIQLVDLITRIVCTGNI